MKLSNIKPISYLKSHAAEIFRNLEETREPYVITQNGEAKAVVVDIKSYEETQETLAFMKIVALARKQYEEGQYLTLEESDKALREQLKKK